MALPYLLTHRSVTHGSQATEFCLPDHHLRPVDSRCLVEEARPVRDGFRSRRNVGFQAVLFDVATRCRLAGRAAVSAGTVAAALADAKYSPDGTSSVSTESEHANVKQSQKGPFHFYILWEKGKGQCLQVTSSQALPVPLREAFVNSSQEL